MNHLVTQLEVQQALDKAYQKALPLTMGNIAANVHGYDPDKFGISVILSDGTQFHTGDTDSPSPLGGIFRIPVATILLSQTSPEQLIEKTSCGCGCNDRHSEQQKLPICRHILRAVSAIEPIHDSDAKWGIIQDSLIKLMDDPPQLDMALYQASKINAKNHNVINRLADEEFYLYDDANIAVDLLLKAKAMTATTRQLATMGATLAADGFNPVSGQTAFADHISRHVIGMIAAKGIHKSTLSWNVKVGLPARSSKAGAIVAILPGTLAIAAYSPRINEDGVSIRASQAIADFARTLNLNAFQAKRTKIVP